MPIRYQTLPVLAIGASRENEARQLIEDAVEELARQGAREMLARALEEEVDEFLGRGRYERGGGFRGYRNGYAPERAIGTGMGLVGAPAPRVAEGPEAAGSRFRSAIIPRSSDARPR